jgi:hypothetical protein
LTLLGSVVSRHHRHVVTTKEQPSANRQPSTIKEEQLLDASFLQQGSVVDLHK